MLVDEEECALEITLFRAWRSVMWRLIPLFILYRLRFVSGVVWSIPARLNSRRAGQFITTSFSSYRCVAVMEV